MNPSPSPPKRLSLALALCGCVVILSPAAAQQKEEEPFWAIGRPKTNADAMNNVAGARLPGPDACGQAADRQNQPPPGFEVEAWASNILDARGMRQGDKSTVFVSSLFVAGKIYAVTDKGGRREVKTIAEKLMAHRHRVPQRLAVCRHAQGHHALRRYRGEARQSSEAGDPKTKELWLGDNGRDWLSEDLPNCELNRVTKVGQHFGFPYCHQGNHSTR